MVSALKDSVVLTYFVVVFIKFNIDMNLTATLNFLLLKVHIKTTEFVTLNFVWIVLEILNKDLIVHVHAFVELADIIGTCVAYFILII